MFRATPAQVNLLSYQHNLRLYDILLLCFRRRVVHVQDYLDSYTLLLYCNNTIMFVAYT